MTSRSRRKHRITALIHQLKAIATRRPAPICAAACLCLTTSLAPLAFADGDQARWSEVRKHRVGASTATLRWRVPTIAAQPTAKAVSHQSQAAPAKPPVQRAVLMWGGRPQDKPRSQVRLTNQTSPIDPFADPFGDRPPAIEPPPRRSYPIGSQDQPFSPLEEPESADSQPDLPMNPFNDDDMAPPPADDLYPEPQMDDSEASPLAPLQPTPDCDRIYNRRDCCKEDELCRDSRLSIRERTIETISLNISPSYKPDAKSQAEADEARALGLAESSIRSWRNREGQVVARGQVTDLRFGRVYIEGEDGEISKIPVRELGDDEWCFLAAWWGVPTECSLGDEVYQPRQWLASTMTWKASALCHKPLYFEEVQLERYGHTAGPFLQPALSGAHFFLNVATLPYQMGINPPHECRYALGYYRPGNCAPWLVPPVPLSVRAGLIQAGAIVGGIYLIP